MCSFFCTFPYLRCKELFAFSLTYSAYHSLSQFCESIFWAWKSINSHVTLFYPFVLLLFKCGFTWEGFGICLLPPWTTSFLSEITLHPLNLSKINNLSKCKTFPVHFKMFFKLAYISKKNLASFKDHFIPICILLLYLSKVRQNP